MEISARHCCSSSPQRSGEEDDSQRPTKSWKGTFEAWPVGWMKIMRSISRAGEAQVLGVCLPSGFEVHRLAARTVVLHYCFSSRWFNFSLVWLGIWSPSRVNMVAFSTLKNICCKIDCSLVNIFLFHIHLTSLENGTA